MTVKEIFETMEYGPAPEATKEAMVWINAKNARFGHFIDGVFTEPCKGFDSFNPTTGKNFLGFQSEGVDPQVNELRMLKFELEKLEDVQIDKCVTRQGFFDIKQ